MRGRTGCKSEERVSFPGFPLVHGEAQSRLPIKTGRSTPRQRLAVELAGGMCAFLRGWSPSLFSHYFRTDTSCLVRAPRMPKVVARQVPSWCQLDGVRFSTGNPFGQAKPAPGKAAQASCERVRRWGKKKKKRKRKINRRMGGKNSNKKQN